MEQRITPAWKDAAVLGLVAGLISSVILFFKIYMHLRGIGDFPLTLLELVLLFGTMLWFGKRRAALYGDDGYSYGRSMSYILIAMVFAGIIYGVAQYFLFNYIFPEYLEETLATTQNMLESMGYDYNMIDQIMRNALTLYGNILFMVFTGIFSMVIYGGFLGLFVSAFVRRQPNIFGSDYRQHNNTDSNATPGEQ